MEVNVLSMLFMVYEELIAHCIQAESADQSQTTQDTSMTLRRVSIFIFLAVVIMLVLVTADLAWDEHAGKDKS